MALWVETAEPVELRLESTEDDLQLVVRSVYKQVLGNQYVMDSDRLTSAESLLRNRSITVRGFVGMVAMSELYQSLFFHPNSPYRFIELNFKHLLGRPPADQAEVSSHVQLYNAEGYEAEIASYLDSDEYMLSYGENTVPYPRSIVSQVGSKNTSFNRSFALMRGPASNDSSSAAKLISALGNNLKTPIEFPLVGNGAVADNTGKQYRIRVSTS
ncbi:MAG: phycobilisome rod-core linker polypeptide, partial [Cyanobacteria bacterium J06642_2]